TSATTKGARFQAPAKHRALNSPSSPSVHASRCWPALSRADVRPYASHSEAGAVLRSYHDAHQRVTYSDAGQTEKPCLFRFLANFIEPISDMNVDEYAHEKS